MIKIVENQDLEQPASKSVASIASLSGDPGISNRAHYEDKLKGFLTARAIPGEHLSFLVSCHSVEDAARAAKAEVTQFVKNVCMIGASRELIVAIVKGEDRASTKKVAKVLNLSSPPRQATPGEILDKTGYPCGGTPSFGYDAIFIVDPRVLDESIVYTGGGSEQSLVKISSQALVDACAGRLLSIRK